MLKFYFRIYNHAAFTWPDDNDFIYLIKLAHVQVIINSWYSVAQMCTHEDMLTHYSDKLANIQVIVNCRYSIAQMCTHEDTLAHYLGAPY